MDEDWVDVDDHELESAGGLYIIYYFFMGVGFQIGVIFVRTFFRVFKIIFCRIYF